MANLAGQVADGPPQHMLREGSTAGPVSKMAFWQVGVNSGRCDQRPLWPRAAVLAVAVEAVVVPLAPAMAVTKSRTRAVLMTTAIVGAERQRTIRRNPRTQY